ncbi:MAG TPA: hypothetical protein DC049_16130, partial [Spirochaetia bacterium]|nr:hypothetical protein [Spirochaetia bacterium]
MRHTILIFFNYFRLHSIKLYWIFATIFSVNLLISLQTEIFRSYSILTAVSSAVTILLIAVPVFRNLFSGLSVLLPSYFGMSAGLAAMSLAQYKTDSLMLYGILFTINGLVYPVHIFIHYHRKRNLFRAIFDHTDSCAAGVFTGTVLIASLLPFNGKSFEVHGIFCMISMFFSLTASLLIFPHILKKIMPASAGSSRNNTFSLIIGLMLIIAALFIPVFAGKNLPETTDFSSYIFNVYDYFPVTVNLFINAAAVSGSILIVIFLAFGAFRPVLSVFLSAGIYTAVMLFFTSRIKIFILPVFVPITVFTIQLIIISVQTARDHLILKNNYSDTGKTAVWFLEILLFPFLLFYFSMHCGLLTSILYSLICIIISTIEIIFLTPLITGFLCRTETVIHPGQPLSRYKAYKLAARSFMGFGPELRIRFSVKNRVENFYARLHELAAQDAVITDLGAGYGFVSLMLYAMSPQRKITAVEYSPDLLLNISLNPLAERFTCINADAAQYMPGPSDFIICMDVLQYIPGCDHYRIISRCCQALNPGGIFYLRTV